MNHLFVFVSVGLLLIVVALLGLLLHLRLHPKDSGLSTPYAGLRPEPGDAAAIDQYLYDRCCRYMMERKPFLVPLFSLQDLAGAVYTNKAYLSKTINRYSGKNFRQYVNYYRVMYAMELFRNNMSLRVTDLADLSGFRSQTVFLRSFKQVMGETPSIWCSRIRKNYNRNT